MLPINFCFLLSCYIRRQIQECNMNTAFPREWHSKLTLTVILGYLKIFQNAVLHVEEV